MMADPPVKTMLAYGVQGRHGPSRRLVVTVVVGLAAVVLVAAALTTPVREDLGWMDALSGTYQTQTVWLSRYPTTPVVTPSPIELRLRKIGVTWRPDWRNVKGTSRDLLGRRLGREHGSAPPI